MMNFRKITTSSEPQNLQKRKKLTVISAIFRKERTCSKRASMIRLRLLREKETAKLRTVQKDRTKLSGSWDSDRQKRQADLDRRLKVDRDAKDRLVKENEKITADIAAVNTKWESTGQDLRVKQQTALRNLMCSGKKNMKRPRMNIRKRKKGVDVKYAQKQVSEKEAQKQQKIKWEEEIQSLNVGKAEKKGRKIKNP
jgi:hypothetical protein